MLCIAGTRDPRTDRSESVRDLQNFVGINRDKPALVRGSLAGTIFNTVLSANKIEVWFSV